MKSRHPRAGRMAATVLAALMILGWIAGSATIAEASEQDTMVLSSWTPTFDAGAISGGSQTVTLTNVGAEAIGAVTFDTRPDPCACAVVGRTVSSGTALSGTWSVTNLAPGETATMSVHYAVRQNRWQSSPSGSPSTTGRFPV